MTDPIRVAVVGAGAIAQVAHLPVLAKLKGVELAAVCDNDYAKASALGARFGIRDVYDDIEDLLTYAHPDVVAVCTPNHLHEVHVIAALSAGAHVLAERPLAMNLEGVQKILAARERTGRVICVGMNQRYRSDVQAVRGFLQGGELGDLNAMRGGWYTFRPSPSIRGWRERGAEAGGGAMLDLALPLIDLGLFLAGRPNPTHVTATISRDENRGLEDSGCALIGFESGLSLFVDVSWHYVGDSEQFWFDLRGSKGVAEVSPLRVFKELNGQAVNVTPTGAAGRESVFTTSYRAEWAHFLAVVRGEVPAPDLKEQLTLHHILAAVYRSAQEGRDVSL